MLDKVRVEQYTEVEVSLIGGLTQDNKLTCFQQFQSTTERTAIEKLKSDFGDRVSIHESSVFPFEDDNLSEVVTKIAPCESWAEDPPTQSYHSTVTTQGTSDVEYSSSISSWNKEDYSPVVDQSLYLLRLLLPGSNHRRRLSCQELQVIPVTISSLSNTIRH